MLQLRDDGTLREGLQKGRQGQREKAETEARDTPKGQGDEAGRKAQANLEDTREDLRENRNAGDSKGSPGSAVESDTSRQSVDGESLALRRMMTTAEEVEDNLSQGRTEKSEECGSLGMWWNSRKRKKAPAARGADPSTGYVKIDATNELKFVKIDVMGSVKLVKLVMTASSRVRSARRANVWRKLMGRRRRIGANMCDVLESQRRWTGG